MGLEFADLGLRIRYAGPRASTDMNALDCTNRAIHRGCDLSPRIAGLQIDDGVPNQYTIDDADRRMV